MVPQNSSEPKPDELQPDATRHINEAHDLLQTLRKRLGTHPELEEAIEKLEMALSILTAESGGLL
jgi:Lon protease-like protein